MSEDDVEDIYELSPMQRGILLDSARDQSSDIYLSQQIYLVEGPLQTGLLQQAWQRVLNHHQALRMSFHWDGLDKPLQVVHREVELPVAHHDWSGLPESEQARRLDVLRADDRAAGMDLTTPPLQRLTLIRTGELNHCIVWTYHHILMDGWSVPVLMADLLHEYEALTGSTVSPPPAAPSLRTYMSWLQQQDLESTREFWRTLLAGSAAATPIPLAPAEPDRDAAPMDLTWARRVVVLPPSVIEAMTGLAARHQVTVGTLVQAGWALVLASYSGDHDVTIGCPTSGRPVDLPGADRIIGVFANTLPLRMAVPQQGELGPWLREIQHTFARMRRYEYTPLSDIQRWAGAGGRQLFQSVLSLESYPADVRSSATLTLRQEGVYDTIGYPIAVSVTPSTGTMNLGVQTRRFPVGFIDELQTRVVNTFGAIVTTSDMAELTRTVGQPLRPVHATGPLDGEDTWNHGADDPARVTEDRDVDRSTIEAAIARVYAEVLDLPDGVDPGVSFFDLGGDSFDAVRAVGRISGANVGLLASNPSARELARVLPAAPAAATHPERPDADEMTPVPREGLLACTYQQEGMWFMNQIDPASTAYHIPFALRLHGPLDVAAMERALLALVVRHEALRTRFIDVDGTPRQAIDQPPESMSLSMVELSADQAEQWAADLCNRPFELASSPAFRAAIARVNPEQHVLAMVLHHIVSDGWSIGVLGEELSAQYAAEAAGERAHLPPLELQPADFAAWQRRRLTGEEWDRQVGFWRETLTQLSHVSMPTDRPRPIDPIGTGGGTGRRLPPELAAAARSYVGAAGVSLLAVLQAALLTVLHRYTGQADLPIGSIVSGRTHPRTEPMVGYFGNVLVLRADVGGRPTFAELARRCHDTILEATAHQDIAFGLVVDALRPVRGTGRNPLFQIALTLHPAGLTAELKLGGLRAESVEVPEYYALYDLAVDVTDSAEGHLDFDVEYATELFDADRIARFADHLEAALVGGLADPDVRIDLIPGLPTPREAAQGPAALSYPQRVGSRAAPRTATERWIADRWRSILGRAEVGLDDDFFACGGSSLQATRFIATVRDELGVSVTVRRLFTDPVLERFAGVIDQLTGDTTAATRATIMCPERAPADGGTDSIG